MAFYIGQYKLPYMTRHSKFTVNVALVEVKMADPLVISVTLMTFLFDL